MAVVDVDQARNDLSEMVDRVQDGERITITSSVRRRMISCQ